MFRSVLCSWSVVEVQQGCGPMTRLVAWSAIRSSLDSANATTQPPL
jgi:hypothetical protein